MFCNLRWHFGFIINNKKNLILFLQQQWQCPQQSSHYKLNLWLEIVIFQSSKSYLTSKCSERIKSTDNQSVSGLPPVLSPPSATGVIHCLQVLLGGRQGLFCLSQ